MAVQRFSAQLDRVGDRVLLRLPFAPDTVWGAKERHHITGTVNGCAIRGALGADADGHFLSLGPAWLRDSGLEVGAKIEVELRPEGPQMEQLDDDIAAALETEPDARAFFQGLATFYRKGYLRWIDATKRLPEERDQRIAEMIRLLKAGEKQRR